ncbi:hypothetical protein [Acidipropionibacterium jensenii]|nr:hypothetical protein [Acidipropionibacterium jensenii]
MTPVVGEGLVVFVNSRVSQVVTSTSPDMLVLHDPVLANLDADGVLSVAGVQGVELWPGDWTVSPGNRTIFDFPDFTVTVTTAHTAAAPLQLWGVAPPDPAPGVPVYTLVVPTGQQPGQTLGWDGSQLAWVTPKITPTVTTLAAGSDATATMTGSWPNLTLGLGIPGKPSTYQIVGAGRPDIPASMTKTVQAQVAAAPIGATFTSTDGASVGAWQWQNLPAGWQIVALDTGWRALTPTGSNVSAFTTLAIRRVNQLVRLRVAGLVLTGTGIFAPAVTGFSPGAYVRFPLLTSGSTTSWTGTLVVTPTGGLQSTAAFSTTGDALEMNWATTDAAPTTLPGTVTS